MVGHTLRAKQRTVGLKNQIICAAGLNLIKALFRYIELLHIVRPCVDTVLSRLTGIFEFYVYCVFLAFTPWDAQQRLLQKYPEDPVEFERIFAMYRAKRTPAEVSA